MGVWFLGRRYGCLSGAVPTELRTMSVAVMSTTEVTKSSRSDVRNLGQLGVTCAVTCIARRNTLSRAP